MDFKFTASDIASLCTLIGTFFLIGKIIFGQGKAKAREEGFVTKFSELKNQDDEFKTDIQEIRADVGEIKVSQEENYGELKLGISELQVNILQEIRKINGK